MSLDTRGTVRGTGAAIHHDPSRVILKRFFPSTDAVATRIFAAVAALSDDAAAAEISSVLARWADRHAHIPAFLRARFSEVVALLPHSIATEQRAVFERLTDEHRMLAASFFVHEYAIEGAALFNPSIVPHPTNRDNGFVLSLRACGEGHISSVVFREGTVAPDGRVALAPAARSRLTCGVAAATDTVNTSPSQATRFRNPITGHEFGVPDGPYTVTFDPATTDLSQRVLFPATPCQSNGIEDARFVYLDDAAASGYYGTVTAYNGVAIKPQMIFTRDFVTFTVTDLAGAISNKGMALFPRRVAGKYWMLSRQDDENVLLMHSTDLTTWRNPEVLLRPHYIWETFKLGNCGSPLETRHGWLVITHGVGPLRRYSLGAALLDINDPTKVLGRLPLPLLSPNEGEREGYVPNVVYTCGAMLRGGTTVVLPYAMSDSSCSFASISVDEIVAAMVLP